jgi:hypothetical protein
MSAFSIPDYSLHFPAAAWHFANMENKITTQADQPLNGAVDSIAPWTIKAVATETRNAAISAARQEGLTVGQWLERRVREWTADSLGAVIPSQKPGQTTPPVGQTPLDLLEMMAVLERAQTAGMTIPKDVRHHAMGLIRSRIREARGLPPLAARKTSQKPGQTVP